MNNKQNAVPRKEIEFVHNLYLSGQIQLSINKIKALGEKYPNQPILYNLMGACYKSLGQLKGAAKMFGIAVSLNPSYAEAYFNLGCIYQDLKQNNAAIESYKKAIELVPRYSEAYNN